MARTLAMMQADLYKESRRLAELAFRRICRNNYERLYLVGAKTAGIWQHFSIASATDLETRWAVTIVRQEFIPGNVTLDHLTEIIRAWLYREPNWMFAE